MAEEKKGKRTKRSGATQSADGSNVPLLGHAEDGAHGPETGRGQRSEALGKELRRVVGIEVVAS